MKETNRSYKINFNYIWNVKCDFNANIEENYVIWYNWKDYLIQLYHLIFAVDEEKI